MLVASGIASAPFGLSNVVAIAAGGEHCLALKSDGTVVSWGSSRHGLTNVPPDLSNIIGIAAGTLSSYAIRSNGTIVGWGASAEVPPGLNNVVAISVGGAEYKLALVKAALSPTLQNTTGQFVNGEFQLQVTGLPFQNFVLEVSPNLEQWFFVMTNMLATGTFTFTDPQSTNFPKRFYRVTMQ